MPDLRLDLRGLVSWAPLLLALCRQTSRADKHREEMCALFGRRLAFRLQRADVRTLVEVRRLGDRELLALKNFGERSLREVRELVPAPCSR